MELSRLAEPFPADDIEWRVQDAKKDGNKQWARVLAYVTNRAIMDRLDAVAGPENWKNEYTVAPGGGILCGLSIWFHDRWITKWDGAENTQIEAVKGGLSGAMKRAAVQWGIGRYLYNLEAGWADICNNGKYSGKFKDGSYYKWNPPKLPGWALPGVAVNPPKKEKKESNPPSKSSVKTKNFEFLKSMGILKQQLVDIAGDEKGQEEYYRVLNSFKFQKADAITDRQDQTDVYHELIRIINESVKQ